MIRPDENFLVLLVFSAVNHLGNTSWPDGKKTSWMVFFFPHYWCLSCYCTTAKDKCGLPLNNVVFVPYQLICIANFELILFSACDHWYVMVMLDHESDKGFKKKKKKFCQQQNEWNLFDQVLLFCTLCNRVVTSHLPMQAMSQEPNARSSIMWVSPRKRSYWQTSYIPVLAYSQYLSSATSMSGWLTFTWSWTDIVAVTSTLK